jgi:hypothetical protein
MWITTPPVRGAYLVRFEGEKASEKKEVIRVVLIYPPGAFYLALWVKRDDEPGGYIKTVA